MCRDSSEHDNHIFDLSYVLPEDLVKFPYNNGLLDYAEWRPTIEKIEEINLQSPLILPSSQGHEHRLTGDNGSAQLTHQASVPKCENDGMIRGAQLDTLVAGQEDPQSYLDIVYPEIWYPPYKFEKNAVRDDIAVAEAKHQKIAAASLDPRFCVGNDLLMRITLICRFSKIRHCRHETCMRRRRALRQVAPPCRWQSFRELILAVLSCDLIRFPMVMGDLIHQQYLREIHPPHFTCIDVHGMLNVLLWAQRISFGRNAPLPKKCLELQTKLLPGYRSKAMTASRKCLEQGHCPNRLWNISHQGPNAAMDILPVAEIALRYPIPGDQTKHMRCTDQFCVYSHDNNTLIQQTHKCRISCEQELSFPPDVLNAAFAQGPALGGTGMQDSAFHTWHQAAWAIGDHGPTRNIIGSAQAYMAISHVWSDGTGVGMKRSGYVNKCLFDYFAEFASRLDCVGVWWDAISIPTDRDARRTAMNTMLTNYEKAAITLVHDEELVKFEWRDDGSPAVALVLSSWFTRGWTAAELYASRSHPVKVVFKGPRDGRPILKDLDDDILALDYQEDIQPINKAKLPRSRKDLNSQGHIIASDILRQLRHGKNVQQHGSLPTDHTVIGDLRSLLRIMRSRTSSWHRDRLIIPGLMCLRSVRFDTSSHGTQITQELMTQFRHISMTDLFHSEVPLASCGPWSWCPPSIFDFGQSHSVSSANKNATCRIKEGRLLGRFEAVWIRQKDTLVPYGSHPAALTRTSVALANRSECFLLTDPSAANVSSLCILAKPVSVVMRGGVHVISCRWFGCVYLTRERQELSSDDRKLRSLRDQQGNQAMFEFGSDADQDGQPLPGFSSKLIVLAFEAFTSAKWEDGKYSWYLKRFKWEVRRDYRTEENQSTLTSQITYASPICLYPTQSSELTTAADEYVSFANIALFIEEDAGLNVDQQENSMAYSFLANLNKHLHSDLKTCSQYGKECHGTVSIKWSFPYPRPQDNKKIKRRMFESTFHIPRWTNETHPGLVFGREIMRGQIRPLLLTKVDQETPSSRKFIYSSYLEDLEDECTRLIANNQDISRSFKEGFTFDSILKDRPSRSEPREEEEHNERRWNFPKMRWKKTSS